MGDDGKLLRMWRWSMMWHWSIAPNLDVAMLYQKELLLLLELQELSSSSSIRVLRTCPRAEWQTTLKKGNLETPLSLPGARETNSIFEVKGYSMPRERATTRETTRSASDRCPNSLFEVRERATTRITGERACEALVDALPLLTSAW